MSRLSKRMTRKPRSASIAQNSWFQPEHLRPQSHHQQQRLAAGVTDLLIGDLDPVGGRQALFAKPTHPSILARTGWAARKTLAGEVELSG